MGQGTLGLLLRDISCYDACLYASSFKLLRLLAVPFAGNVADFTNPLALHPAPSHPCSMVESHIAQLVQWLIAQRVRLLGFGIVLSIGAAYLGTQLQLDLSLIHI